MSHSNYTNEAFNFHIIQLLHDSSAENAFLFVFD